MVLISNFYLPAKLNNNNKSKPKYWLKLDCIWAVANTFRNQNVYHEFCLLITSLNKPHNTRAEEHRP